jgi:uncharacterized protein YeaO (DUF488 family)
MTINTKRVHDPAEAEDGTRILIVRRPWIANMKKIPYDEIRKELSPSETLFGMYYLTIKDNSWGHASYEWHKYSKRFIEEMNTLPESKQAIEELRERSKTETITLLCYCKDEEYCHRTLVKNLIEPQSLET